ncbi:hypothetical protein ACF061_08735 [Streptomyces sp. NPDC015220]|uniref:hypothetical protein n=1 Tax=Streptomyces sp. NPDC015220 TaxID=3364947 RepID=UPI0036F56BC7
MHSEPAHPVLESRAAARRGHRRERGGRPAEGPVFVDVSGRRSKVLRRVGLLVGFVCLAYTAVLGAAFMGWGTSLNPSSLLPFGGDRNGAGDPGGFRPRDGAVRPAAPSGATPSAAATGSAPAPPAGAAASPSSTPASASAVAVAD